MGIATELRGRRVINARGYSTKVGGSRLAPGVTAAMTEAAGFFVRIEDMQAAAGAAIVAATGAEAGYVTGGCVSRSDDGCRCGAGAPRPGDHESSARYVRHTR